MIQLTYRYLTNRVQPLSVSSDRLHYLT